MFLGIDYGKKRIGLALGEILPKGAGVLKADSPDVFFEIKKICQENEVEKIVIGLPTFPSGDEGGLAGEVKAFADKLSKELNIETILEPEGFTSTEAEQILRNNNEKYDCKSGKIDEMAAVLILEQYINNLPQKQEITL